MDAVQDSSALLQGINRTLASISPGKKSRPDINALTFSEELIDCFWSEGLRYILLHTVCASLV